MSHFKRMQERQAEARGRKASAAVSEARKLAALEQMADELQLIRALLQDQAEKDRPQS